MSEVSLMHCITFTKIKTMNKNYLKTKDTKKFDYQKLRLIDDYPYNSEEEKEQKTSKKPDKIEPPKKLAKDDFKKLNK